MWLTPDAPPTSDYVCRRLRIPRDPEWLSFFNGALVLLTREYMWEPFGALTPAETAERMQDIFLEYLESDECMIGSIIAYATAQPPNPSILPCDGLSYLREDFPRLYAKIDPVYHLDADTFRVPDLRGRTIVGVGTGVGLTERVLDAAGGVETVTLTVDELPAHDHTTEPHSHSNAPHSHTYTPPILNIDLEAPGAPDVFAAGVGFDTVTSAESVSIDAETVTVNEAGGNEAHENMPPFVALHYGIVAW